MASFEIEDYDDGELEQGVAPSRPQASAPQEGAEQSRLEPVSGTPSGRGAPVQPIQQYDVPPKKVGKLTVFAKLLWYYKAVTIPVTVLVIALVLLAVPATRYPIVGLVLRRHYDVQLVDAKTKLPVSGAIITIGDKRAETDGDGRASVSVRVGNKTLRIEKKYYQSVDQPVFVGIAAQQQPTAVPLVATGRQVPIVVMDKISNKPVGGATIKVADTSAKTDKSGKTYVVLPTTQSQRAAVVSQTGYNDSNVTVQVTDQVTAANTFKMTPAGRIMYLSNANGPIDVVAANLDGSDRKTIVQATGNEDASTQLFVSPSLKYAALFAKRDAGKDPRLHIIDTSNGSVKLMDSALAFFQPIGWAGDSFVYTDSRQDLQRWQTGQSELKAYSPADGTVTVLDKSTGEGTKQEDYIAELIQAVSIVDGNVLYAKAWSAGGASGGLANRQNVINKVQPNGKGRQTLRAIPQSANAFYSFINDTRIKPQVVYFQSSIEGTTVFYAYQNNSVTQSNTITMNDVTKEYPNYFVSPDGNKTVWSEVRDGQSKFFVGSANAGDAKQIAALDGFSSTGWYGNGYLLLSKESQLYIIPADGLAKGQTPLRISGYYSPSRGYGY